jgi:uncharacterized cupredoxin-like copper-binding protein
MESSSVEDRKYMTATERKDAMTRRSRTGTLQAAAALALLGAAFAIAAPAAAGPGEKGHSHDHQHQHSENSGNHGDGHAMKGGRPGTAAEADRTVRIVARDTEFNLSKIQVEAGETVRFVIRNTGDLVHEFTIGTPEMQRAHQEEMARMMEQGHFSATEIDQEAHHGHANSALIGPGEEAEVVWTFEKTETLEFACNIPGHYEQGMKGEFVFAGGA